MPKRPSLADAASRLESSVLTETRKAADAVNRNSANEEERKTVKLSFAIPIRTHEELKVLAARRHQAIGALVENLIDAELARQK